MNCKERVNFRIFTHVLKLEYANYSKIPKNKLNIEKYGHELGYLRSQSVIQHKPWIALKKLNKVARADDSKRQTESLIIQNEKYFCKYLNI